MNLPGRSPISAHSCRAIEEKSVEWISRRDAGLTSCEEAEFQAWLAADPRHLQTIEKLQPAWLAMNRLRHAGRGADLRAGVERFAARRRRRRVAVGLASLAAAAALAFGLLISRPVSHLDSPGPTIAIRADRQLLPDGSMIDLNAGAEVAIEYTPQVRGVRLVSGEALFHVTNNENRPFVVRAGDVAVQAVGTAFKVRLGVEDVDVLVTEGRVAVQRTSDASVISDEQLLYAAAGQMSAEEPPETTGVNPPWSFTPTYISAGTRLMVPLDAELVRKIEPLRVSPNDIAVALAWRNQRVEFNGTTLAEAVELFNRDNSTTLVVSSPAAAALRITGVFWTNDPEAFSRALETSLGLNAVPDGLGRIFLRK